MTRWVGLVRVSADDQVGGADTQEVEIRQWAEDRDETIVAVFADVGVPGTLEHLPARDAIGAALEAVATGVADGIVVWKLDRLARELVLQERLLTEFRAAGAEVASVQPEEHRLLEGGDDDPSRTLIRLILGAVAQYDRDIVKMRCRAGAARARAAGQFMGGPTPYGTRIDPVTRALVLDEHESRVIGEAMALKSLGLTYPEVGEFLCQAGLPPRRLSKSKHAPETVRYILRAGAERGITAASLSMLGRRFAGSRGPVASRKRI